MLTKDKQISKAVISRLPRYYRYLGELMEEGIERISSNELSARMKVTASQIRQDLNNFGGFGQQGYGYNVEYLYQEIGKILGLDVEHHLIIVGAGNLGQALANYMNFKEERGEESQILALLSEMLDNEAAFQVAKAGVNGYLRHRSLPEEKVRPLVEKILLYEPDNKNALVARLDDA